MRNATDGERVAEKARAVLDLAGATLGDEYRYHSLPLCVIDAVFSIGVKYTSVQNAVRRYCEYFEVPSFRLDPDELPSRAEQLSITALCQQFDTHGVQHMADVVFDNRQRTSTRSGITKAEAVWQFAKVLRQHNFENLQDMMQEMPETLIHAIRTIAGQGSGISLEYFRMLAGHADRIKPDRMVLRFLADVLQRTVSVGEAPGLLQEAVQRLQRDFPQMSARLLDHLVWQWQRQAVPLALAAASDPAPALLSAVNPAPTYDLRDAFVTRNAWERLLELRPSVHVQPHAVQRWLRVDPDAHAYALKVEFVHPEPLHCADGVWRVVTQWDSEGQRWTGDVLHLGTLRATVQALLAAREASQQDPTTAVSDDKSSEAEKEALRQVQAGHPALAEMKFSDLDEAINRLRRDSLPDALLGLRCLTES